MREQAIYISQSTAALTSFGRFPALDLPRRGGVSSKPIRQDEYTSCIRVSSGDVDFSVLQWAPAVSPGRGSDNCKDCMMQKTIGIPRHICNS